MKVSPLTEIFQVNVLDKLSVIDGVSVLDGYLAHYVKDLHAKKRGLSFPCVAAQPLDDTIVSQNGGGVKGVVHRQIKVIGAVSTLDPSKVNAEINDLIYTVRCALAVDYYETRGFSIKLGNAQYDLPESGDSYAFFEMLVTIEYNEKWS